jgi:hypothetical protein
LQPVRLVRVDPRERARLDLGYWGELLAQFAAYAVVLAAAWLAVLAAVAVLLLVSSVVFAKSPAYSHAWGWYPNVCAVLE